MGKVFAVLIIIALGAFVVYEVISLILTLHKKFSKKKKQDNTNNVTEEGD